MKKVNNIKFNIIYKKRRKGDAPVLFADNSKILKKTNGDQNIILRKCVVVHTNLKEKTTSLKSSKKNPLDNSLQNLYL